MWTGKRTKLFSERNEQGRLVVGEVVIDDYGCYCHTHNTPLGRQVSETKPIYREVLRSRELTGDEEDWFWEILENEDDPYAYHSQTNAILYFLEGKPIPKQEVIFAETHWWDTVRRWIG